MRYATRRIRSVVDRAQHPDFGDCYRCHLTWATAKSHTTDYIDSNVEARIVGAGCFPLCEDCWQELGTPEARMPFYEALMVTWDRSGHPTGDAGKIRSAVGEGK